MNARLLITNNTQGFTLVEVVMVLGLMVMMGAGGLWLGFDFYHSFARQSNISTIATLLQTARSQSMDNIDQTRHGIEIESAPLRLILFECPRAQPDCTSYTASPDDSVFEISSDISLQAPQTPVAIMFDQLSGNCLTNCTRLEFSQANRIYAITINSQGRIDW